jgi:hypothetical protein
VIGAPPAFLDEASPLSPTIKFRAEAAIKALEDGRREAQGHLRRFLGDCLHELNGSRILQAPSGYLDDEVIRLIRDMTPLRDYLLRVFDAVCTFSSEIPIYKEFHSFLERSVPLMFRSSELKNWDDRWFDHFRFSLRELLLYLTASLIKHERFPQLKMFLETDFCSVTPDRTICDNFCVFGGRINSINGERNRRLELNRTFLVADLFKERSPAAGIDFDGLMQADVILALVSAMDGSHDAFRRWLPETAVYTERSEGAMHLFARFQSGRKSDEIGILFGTPTPAEFLIKLDEAYEKSRLDVMDRGYFQVPWHRLTGVANVQPK